MVSEVLLSEILAQTEAVAGIELKSSVSFTTTSTVFEPVQPLPSAAVSVYVTVVAAVGVCVAAVTAVPVGVVVAGALPLFADHVYV